MHTLLTLPTASRTLPLTSPQLPSIPTSPHSFARSLYALLTPWCAAPLAGPRAAPSAVPQGCPALPVPRARSRVSARLSAHSGSSSRPSHGRSVALRAAPQQLPLSRGSTRVLTRPRTPCQLCTQFPRLPHTLSRSPHSFSRLPRAPPSPHRVTSASPARPALTRGSSAAACASPHTPPQANSCPEPLSAPHSPISRSLSRPHRAPHNLFWVACHGTRLLHGSSHTSTQHLHAGLAPRRCSCGPSPASSRVLSPCPPLTPTKLFRLRLRTQGRTAAQRRRLPARLLHDPQAPTPGRLSRDAPQAMPTRGSRSGHAHNPALSCTRLIPVLVPVSSQGSPGLLPPLVRPTACSPLTGPAQLRAGLLCAGLPRPPPPHQRLRPPPEQGERWALCAGLPRPLPPTKG